MDIQLFVLSYIIQLIGSGILLYRVYGVKSIYGLSIDTQVCFVFSTLSRCVWSMNTRIIQSSTWFAFLAVIELLFSVVACVVLVNLFRKLLHTTTMESPHWLTWYVLVPTSFVVALAVNPGAWFTFTAQVLVAFTMYVEAVALFPQLYLIRKMDDVEALTSHYIGLLIIARIVRMIFWVFVFFGGQRFICLFVADLIHTALSADYLYLWIRKIRNGGRLVYSL